ncbi:dipeptide transport system permease protein DppB [Microcystis aeruginosa NIES-2519]|uniref:Dipeptide transport system permease protein DppB n=1 Tax=Microcystis aeruginosa NIES-2519 TaxID=2303981 RepID=A0A5A5RE21_MICAE|nr:ABC transporter permease [Microcystis aeruginosa]GCA73109.1 dipeptide transport system permease protein DppB [Microcystis aeruginosa NIES-2519]GCA86602.1 dipeptide transport system permease protein DppB [Microcystis aeruginosa NIES-2522]
MSRRAALQSYLLVRLLLAPLMLWTIVTVVFLLMRVAPGDPTDAILGNRAPESAKNALREQLGLNKPLFFQYLDYIFNLMRLNLGDSLTSKGVTVWEIIAKHFPATVELTFYGMLIAVIVGVGLGIITASRPNTPLDAGGRLFGLITYSLPIFWVGMLLQLIFAVQLRWFPLGTRFPLSETPPQTITGLYTLDSLMTLQLDKLPIALYYLVLPSFTLGILLSGIFERMVRVNLKQTLQADYVDAAKARGIPEKTIMIAHALKNALIPVITVLGLTFAALLGGAVLTEVTFSWPGLGNQLYRAISLRDYPTVQGLMAFFATIVVLASILIDLINAYIDPRIRY